MKKIILFLLICSSLFSQSFYTLDNIKSLSLYMPNKATYMDKEQKKSLKDSVVNRLTDAGFVFGKTDATTFMLKIDSISVNDTEVIYIQLGIGEEVLTSRPGKIHSFAFTYLANDFIDSDEPLQDTIESVNFLMSEFLEAYKDDNE
ncbi:hypothetical protein [Sulfurimonas sp.]|uniref:hypothetical protein n=1 Tax=Sulfurimonas sp. TaxID=2022749 RepID=UPI003562693C